MTSAAVLMSLLVNVLNSLPRYLMNINISFWKYHAVRRGCFQDCKTKHFPRCLPEKWSCEKQNHFFFYRSVVIWHTWHTLSIKTLRFTVKTRKTRKTIFFEGMYLPRNQNTEGSIPWNLSFLERVVFLKSESRTRYECLGTRCSVLILRVSGNQV